jgi:TM2 domain-containing membrane protein YozV
VTNLTDLGAWCEIGGFGISLLIGYLMWASGYAGVLWNNAKRNRWRSPPLKDCTTLNML